MPLKVEFQLVSPKISETFNLSFGPTKKFVIGRKESDLCIDDAKISKHHLSLKREGKDLVAEDLGSSNGTLYHDEKLTSHILIPGDELKVGSHVIKIISVQYEKTPRPDSLPDSEELQEAPPIAFDGFQFFPDKKLTPVAIKDTYVSAFKNFRTFWQTVPLDVSSADSVKVLIAVSICYTVAVDGVAWGKMSLGFVLGFLLIAVFCPLVISAVFEELAPWHKGEGEFTQYVAFAVYWYFFNLPFVLILPFVGGFGAVASLVLLVWGTIGFEKRFHPDRGKFAALLVGLYLGSFLLFGSLMLKLFSERTAG